MGLDCYIRKISKRKAHLWGVPNPAEEVGAPFYKVPGNHALTNEIAYWRGHSGLNKWMMALARERGGLNFPIVDPHITILLREEDLEALRFELIFGDVFHNFYKQRNLHPSSASIPLAGDSAAIEKALRIARCNRSYIYFHSNW